MVTEYCCKFMQELSQNPRVGIQYDDVLREYFVTMYQSTLVQLIWYCPWCGAKLPKSLRNEYFALLEKKYGITPADAWDNADIPGEFNSDQWWKDRLL